MDSGGRKEVYIRKYVLAGVQNDHAKGQFNGQTHAQAYPTILCVSCAKTAEPIELSFGLCARVG